MRAVTPVSSDQHIAEEAASWLMDLEEDDADLAGFAAWLEASPRNVEEFLLCSAVWRAADGIDPARRIDVETLLRQANAAVHRLDEDLPHPSSDRRHRNPRVLRGALSAAAVLIAIVGVLFVSLNDGSSSYRTGVGEQRTLKLADGSIVMLNTRSRIKVRMEKRQRAVELIEGEALFEVAHDQQRPFRVLSGATVVQAIGTQFNVNRSQDATIVAVVEGIVEVAPRSSRTNRAPERLVAGEQAQVSEQGKMLEHAAADIERILAWRERRLVFRNESLGAIAAEFNRYNDVQLRIEGAATSARQITAVFDADNPQALIAFLERDPQLSVQSRGSAVVIRGP